MSTAGFTVEPIPENRFDEVIEHLRYNFFADEPLNNAVGLCRKGEPHQDLESHCLMSLKQGYCRMLVTEDGTIAGLALNGIQKKGEREEAERRLSELDDVKFKTIFGLLYKLNEQVDLFEKYGIEEIFECRILSVDDEFRGKGLANVLASDSLETARKAGFKSFKGSSFQVFKADATGIFSQKVFAKHGFETVAELPYTEIDEKIRPGPPHRSLKLMIKVLN